MAATNVFGAEQQATSSWQISRTVAALTDLPSVSAQLESNETLRNSLNLPEKAALVLRCRDREMAAYVAWPEFLPRDSTSAFLEAPQKLVLQRVDDGPITSAFWDIADGGTAAGGFNSRNALKILGPIEHARKLVVRMSGSKTQDATFDLAGITAAAAEIRSVCGMAAAAEPQRSQSVFGPVYRKPLSSVPADAFSQSQASLEAEGYLIAEAQPETGTITTKPKLTRLTTKEADCGKYAGLPYLLDKRALTDVTLRITIQQGALAVEAKVDGLYNSKPQKLLTCRPSGLIEQRIAEKLAANIH